MMFLTAVARQVEFAEKWAAVNLNWRDLTRVVQPSSGILQARILVNASGYEEAGDLDALSSDPALELACGRLPDSCVALASQPIASRR